MKNSYSYSSYKKSPYKSIKHSTYFESYDHFFSKYRGKNITFVEIGILSGGSLFMWREFFGDQARIIGVDFNENALKWKNFGFEIFIGDQSNKDFWEEFKKDIGNIDIVLDDGGHTYQQQIMTIECLLETINDGGIILVEDTHTSYLDGFGPSKFSFINYVKNLIDKINYRFGEFSRFRSERRVWSIEIIESMVAFRVNRKASNLDSFPTDNEGLSDLAKDARYKEISSINFLKEIKNKLPFLEKIPLSRVLAKLYKSYLVNKNFDSKKYFN